MTKNNSPAPEQPQYQNAIIYGGITSIIVAVVLTALAILFEYELDLFVAIGAAAVGFVIARHLPHKTVWGAVIGAVLCPATYLLYQLFLAMFGYYYAEDGDLIFWAMLVAMIILGAHLGYNKKEEK